MNARQKAKHFKRLYEESLPKKPYPIVYQTHNNKHYKVRHMVNTRDIVYEQSPTMLQTQILNGILRELRPIIWDNLVTEKDIYTDKYIYSLDIWM